MNHDSIHGILVDPSWNWYRLGWNSFRSTSDARQFLHSWVHPQPMADLEWRSRKNFFFWAVPYICLFLKMLIPVPLLII